MIYPIRREKMDTVVRGVDMKDLTLRIATLAKRNINNIKSMK